MDTKLFARKQPGGVFTVYDREQFPGSIWWVDSTNTSASDAAGFGVNPDAPFATLDYAVGACTASKGDVIFLMPGHAESKAAAGDLATIDVAGIAIIGLGNGSLRPTFTLAHADATITVSAANVLIRNVVVTSNVADMKVGLTTSNAADGLTVDACSFTAPSTDKEMLKGISLAAGTDSVTISNCYFFFAATNDSTAAVFTVGACDQLKILNNTCNGNFEAAVFDLDAAANTNLIVIGNVCVNSDTGAGLVVANHNSATGIVANNLCGGSKSNTYPVTGTGLHYLNNLGTEAANTQAVAIPATATNFGA